MQKKALKKQFVSFKSPRLKKKCIFCCTFAPWFCAQKLAIQPIWTLGYTFFVQYVLRSIMIKTWWELRIIIKSIKQCAKRHIVF